MACIDSNEFSSSPSKCGKMCKDVLPYLVIGCVVPIKEDNLPPLVWKKSIVTEVHFGTDGLVHVATIKPAT
ncbi:hypothetical protein PR048_033756 [Dryococelus australis]|uniref:DUF5641 domain-containing protein n=1 Tax=Dryococelus australis TaxID=614101 RepID=A0ABQ9G1V7_9NEOP|nr:hypothetical protein PR048_033756 [Dryococelus australis]